jgi:hypothetical protein
MSNETRKYARLRPGVAVRFFGEPIDRTTRQYLTGAAENCGLGGMFISTEYAFSKGSIVTLDFRIDSESRGLTPVRAYGIVSLVQRKGGIRGMGIQFIEFEGLGDRIFSDWIKEVLKEHPEKDENEPGLYSKIAGPARFSSPQATLFNRIAR